MDDTYLSELVGQHPCLYDAKNKHYKDQNVRDNVWTDIADKIGQPVEECKKRWKNIRDTYNRRKKGNKGSTGSARNKIPCKWYLADAVSFLNKVEQERKCTSNVEIMETKDTEQEKDDEENSVNEHEKNEIISDEDEIKDDEVKVKSPEREIEDKPLIGQKKGNVKLGSYPKRQKLTEKVLDVFTKNSEQRHKLLQKNLEKCTEEHPVDIFFKSMAASVKKMSYPSQVKAKMETCRIIGELELEELQRPSSGLSYYSSSTNPEYSNSYHNVPISEEINQMIIGACNEDVIFSNNI